MGLASRIRLLTERPRIVTAATTANWNSGVATSGLAGADLFTYGAANQWWRLQEAYILLSAFNAAATVTVRAYMNLMGAERQVMSEDWVVAVDPPVIYVVWFWEVEMFGPLRIEALSDQAADDGLAAPYEYRIKDW
jgi:hypothetical protein